jgi:hypothetical protein
MIIIADISVVEPFTGLMEVIRVTNSTHYTYEDKTYIPELSLTGGYKQSLFSKNTTSGAVTVDITDIELGNTDGIFDKYKSYGFAGHPVSIWLLETHEDVPNPLNLYFKGITASREPSLDSFKINLTNNLEKLSVQMAEKVFTSDNAGPVGLEGNDDTLKNKIKPMVYGRLFNIELTAVNTSALVYSCNYTKEGERKPIHRVLSVKDKGGELSFDGDYADAAALVAATVALNSYATCLAEGLIRLRSKPVGTVTADIYESEAAQCSAPRVVERILKGIMGLVPGVDFNAGDLNILHEKNACPVGISIQDKEDVLSVINNVLDSIGGWMCPDSSGVLRFGRVEDPSNYESTFLIDSHIKDSLKSIGTNESGKGIPSFKLELKHTRNWSTSQAGALLESIEPEVKDALTKDYVIEEVQNSLIKTVHPLSETLTYETLLHQPIATFTTGGQCSAADNYSFTGSQISGSGGSKTASGNLTIIPGTGIYRVVQAITSGLIPGDLYAIELFSVSGTVIVRVKDSGALVKEVTIPNLTTKREKNEILFTSISTSFNLEFEVTTGTGTAVIGAIRIRETAPGLSPKQEAERRFALQSKTQDLYTLEVDLEDAKRSRLGQVGTFKLDRFDLTEGQKFLVIGKDEDLNEETASIDLWKINEY